MTIMTIGRPTGQHLENEMKRSAACNHQLITRSLVRRAHEDIKIRGKCSPM